jgi:hypothetical protein
MRIKVTMADGKVIIGERRWYDVFLDGWGTTAIHNYEKFTDGGIILGKGKMVKVSNKWIVMEEGEADAKS